MQTVTTSVRLPQKVKQQAEELVKRGYFKNLSDVVLSGIRNEITLCSNESVMESRKAKQKVWADVMRRAKGDKKKAIEIYIKDIEKAEKEDPEFFKL